MRALDRLRKSGFELPEPPPRHQFVPVAVVGDLAFVSGHAPYRDGAFRFKGKVGRKLDLSAAQQAAGLALLGCLRSLHDRFETLDAVKRILKLNAYVNCVPNFREPPSVSERRFGHARGGIWREWPSCTDTVGVCSLPAGVAVEIELVVQVGIEGSEPKRSWSHNEADKN
jgi:enamine deaminase RidA (YjgF/YER057c/UK114 family)